MNTYGGKALEKKSYILLKSSLDILQFDWDL